ncbi:hypothetical protein DDZ13_07895 [Coraliomargarita sinensis]|uniref:Uncharacterized protein n=1 Tax=Coraliomargarita sinensis TaxID=2174842 RepID=A0A317ZHI4_9BACT|nr:hypothetical protein [Coraliomargarita sinensis]PXA04442.1 hypothetical protein DDZ13_07895 [Coraliomargarita sinensis]
MAGFDENIVREYFELNKFFVRQLKKYQVQTRKKQADEAIALVVYNPGAPADDAETGYQLFSADMLKIQRAVVVVQAWHSSRFTPSILKSSSRIFDYLKKNVLNRADQYFDFEEALFDEETSTEQVSCKKILVLPGIPTSDPQRSEAISLFQESGIDGIITFSTILENLLRHVEVNHSYQKSELLQLMRVLKLYDMVKEPQMNLFG